MNRARSDRTLGSMDETTHKRLKTVDKTEQRPGAEVDSVFGYKQHVVFFVQQLNVSLQLVISIVTKLFLPFFFTWKRFWS